MRLIFTHLKPDIWQYKAGISLREKEVKVVSISLLSFNKEMFKNAFDEIICLNLPNLKPKTIWQQFKKNPSNFSKFFRRIRKIKADAVICEGAPHYLTSFFIWLFKGRFPRIYFPYDMSFSMYKKIKDFIPRREIWGEKYSFKNCDAILQKNGLGELDMLPKEFGIENKPKIHFSCYPLKKWFIDYDPKEKLSQKNKEFHLVYIGFFVDITLQLMTKNVSEILGQKIHLHIYPNEVLNEELIQRMTKNKKELIKYLHIHQYTSPDKLSNDLSKYDFGIFYAQFSNELRRDYLKYGFGNKRSSYFEALIPMVSHEDFIFVNKPIKKNNLGIIIENFENLMPKLKKFNYKKGIKNIENFREETSVENNIDRLIKFVEKLNEK